MQNWEYVVLTWEEGPGGTRRAEFTHRKTEPIASDALLDTLQSMGDDGWELVAGTTVITAQKLYFKRPKS